MGVRKTTDFLEKATWTLGIVIVVLSVASSAVTSSSAGEGEDVKQSKMQEQVDDAALTPVAPIENGVPLPSNGAPAPTEQPAPAEGDK